MFALAHDLKLTFRMLAKRPAFASVAIVVMALGIGANTLIFSVVYGVLLQQLPFKDTARIVQLWHVPPQSSFPGLKQFALSAANYLDWKAQNHVFDAMALYDQRRFDITSGAEPETVGGAGVTAEFFSVLGVQPILGRAFLPEEDQPGRNREVLLSYKLWQSRFSGDPGAIGQVMRLDGEPYTVVGVMGPRITKPGFAKLWVPMGMTDREAAVRSEHHFLGIARLRPGVSIAQAQAELDSISRRLAQTYPEDDKGWGALVVGLREQTVGDIRPVLLMMMGAVTFVLLIACANVANLILARTLERRKEIAIRSAVGGRRLVLIRQIVLESVVLSMCGGLLGLFLAHFGTGFVVKFFADRLPQTGEIGLNGPVLLFTLLLAMLTGVLAGLLPSWSLTNERIGSALKQGLGHTDATGTSSRLRSALVVIEVSLSFVLLIGAGLMVRTLWALQDTNPGFDPHDVLTADVHVTGKTFASPAQESQFFSQVLTRLRGMPGIESAGAVDDLPLVGGSNQPVAVEGQPVLALSEQPEVSVRVAVPGYMQTMRIPLLQGRDISESDTANSAAVVVISESMAKQFWPHGDAVGHHVKLSFFPERDRLVVGVVGDVKQNGLDTNVGISSLYWPLAQTVGTPSQPWRPVALSVVIRRSPGAQSLEQAIATAVHEVNKNIPVLNSMTMHDFIALTVAQPTVNMELLITFAILALTLSVVGIYSVLAYSVRRRMREIALRIALGASGRDVMELITIQAMKPALLGMLLGIVAALLLGRLLASLVYGVKPTDLPTLVSVTILMGFAAFAASLLPSFRATQIDPLTILRDE